MNAVVSLRRRAWSISRTDDRLDIVDAEGVVVNRLERNPTDYQLAYAYTNASLMQGVPMMLDLLTEALGCINAPEGDLATRIQRVLRYANEAPTKHLRQRVVAYTDENGEIVHVPDEEGRA